MNIKKKQLKICANPDCGKKFLSRGGNYCSKQCRSAMRKKREDESGQLCWNCKKACGGCSWSSSFTPIPGWEATPHITDEDNERPIHTYHVKSCPEFVRGR